MQFNNWKKELLTIPNLLSISRLLLIPVYILIYLNAVTKLDYFVAAAILAVSCLTDMIDGKIARRFSMVTNLGKILDPLADKATQLTLIVCLSLKYPILIALIALFIVKESFQVIAGAINLQKGIMLKGALISGKICTTILFITLIVLVLIPEIPYPYVVLLSSVDMILMGVTFIDYCITYAKKDHKFQSIDTNN